jgi:5-hydroxyisourate hydrolase-like protein (transthyretin family)
MELKLGISFRNYPHKIMKTLLFVFLLFLLIGCEKEYDNIIDPNTNVEAYQVLSVNSPENVRYTDENVSISVEINNWETQINNVWVSLISPNNIEITFPLEFSFENGEVGNFITEIPTDSLKIAGRYKLYFVVEDFQHEEVLIGISYFDFISEVVNTEPQVSNLLIPTQIQRNTAFTFTIEAEDSNGYSDIKLVFYRLYDIDGNLIVNNQNISEYPLSDSGDTSESGDVTANDGIFTNKLVFPTTAVLGTYRFEFQVRDYSNALSNVISHNIEVIE